MRQWGGCTSLAWPGCRKCLICIKRYCWTWPCKGKGSLTWLLSYVTSSSGAKIQAKWGQRSLCTGTCKSRAGREAALLLPISVWDFWGLDTSPTPPAPDLLSTAPCLPAPQVPQFWNLLSFQAYFCLLQRQQAGCRNILKVPSRVSEVFGQGFVSLWDAVHFDRYENYLCLILKERVQ